ncbi:amino acid permease [Marispirochaeta aestuarii]|uniref:amino acid permease n=1 Tax=Marispirochaeta aestuarii TaxID=1963862 RepID=UPI0029C6996B|nr:amino acid permease [Marispirochaeta aestuarii]
MGLRERGFELLQHIKGWSRKLDKNRRPLDGSTVITAEFDPHDTGQSEEARLRTLGTFGGVFTPSFLTIIGVIMYLRFGWIVGNAGLFGTLAIVFLANTITFITALSVSSIGSNERMETGGAYFMINRVLGFLPGGAVGIPLYLSQALSIALYIIGFSESLANVVPAWDIRIIALATLGLLSLLALIGAAFMVRIQYIILSLIILSFVSIAAGFRPAFANIEPSYLEGVSFWGVFAVFFPAVTGILSGVSMSGDLKNPGKSIPRGTLAAVAVGFIVYLLVPVMLAFSVARDDLFASSSLVAASRWPLLVTLGVFGATLSSAIGVLLAAPRTMQALGSDGALPRIFGSGVGKTREPILGLSVSVLIALGAIVMGNLNAVAEVLTMFFLTTYGVLNLAAGMEKLVGNPSFRPSISIPWWISFMGAAGCFGVMFLINTPATLIALALVVLVFFLLSIRARNLDPGSPGIWEGFWTGLFFIVSRKLAKTRSRSGKNWRPLIQIFAAEIASHAEIISLAALFTRHSGALAIYAVRDPASPQSRDEMQHELDSFNETLHHRNIFTTMVETGNLFDGILISSQSAAFAGGVYNTVMLGFPSGTKQDRDYAGLLMGLSSLDKNILLFKRGTISWHFSSDPVIVWWGGQEQNVRLMLFLAHLVQRNSPQHNRIRLGTIVSNEEDVPAAEARLASTLQELRMQGEIFIVPNPEKRQLCDVIEENSRESSLVLLGMAKPREETLGSYLPGLRTIAGDLQNLLFVLSNIPEQEYE